MGVRAPPPGVWLPAIRATSSAETQPSFSLKFSARTVYSCWPDFAYRRVSVMFPPHALRLPPTVPRWTSSQLTVLHEYVLYAPPASRSAVLTEVITSVTEVGLVWPALVSVLAVGWTTMMMFASAFRCRCRDVGAWRRKER